MVPPKAGQGLTARCSTFEQLEGQPAAAALVERKRDPNLEHAVDERLLVGSQVDGPKAYPGDDLLDNRAVPIGSGKEHVRLLPIRKAGSAMFSPPRVLNARA